MYITDAKVCHLSLIFKRLALLQSVWATISPKFIQYVLSWSSPEACLSFFTIEVSLYTDHVALSCSELQLYSVSDSDQDPPQPV